MRESGLRLLLLGYHVRFSCSGWLGHLILVSDFSDAELRTLSSMAIVPAADPQTGTSTRNYPPNQCYFLRPDAGQRVHSKLFASVDFGARANGFLTALGTKEEPSVDEVAQMLVRAPREFWRLAGGRDAFLAELRNIAVNRRGVSAPVYNRMKKSGVLLGQRRKRKESAGEKEKEAGFVDEEDVEFEDDLLRPDELVIADDTNEWQLFGDEVFCCPQEDLLEGMRFSFACLKRDPNDPQSSTQTWALEDSLPS
jgi:hypothetical protein